MTELHGDEEEWASSEDDRGEKDENISKSGFICDEDIFHIFWPVELNLKDDDDSSEVFNRISLESVFDLFAAELASSSTCVEGNTSSNVKASFELSLFSIL